MYKILLLLLTSTIFSSNCDITLNNTFNERAIYSIGDTLSFEDQNLLYPVCNGNDIYNDDDTFSFSDLNGNLNTDYKITIISMNATW